MAKSFKLTNFILICFFLTLNACAPKHAKIPSGEIPLPTPVSPSEEKKGQQALTQLRKHYELDFDHPKYNDLIEVVENISVAAGAGKQLWHVYVLKDDAVKNAAATSGNHLFFWTGMLDFTKNKDEIATVAGHEIAHVLAKHTSPNPAQSTTQILLDIASAAAAIAVSQATNGQVGSGSLAKTAGSLTKGIGAGIFVNPYTRELETEADEVGLFLMAKAGYPPQAAYDFWNRFQSDTQTSIPFFSTHPPAKERLSNLNRLLPRANKVYQGEPINPPSTLLIKESSDYIKLSGTKAAKSWQVTSRTAPIHKDSSVDSKVLSTLKEGQNFQVETRVGPWLRITSPVKGYVMRRNAVNSASK